MATTDQNADDETLRQLIDGLADRPVLGLVAVWDIVTEYRTAHDALPGFLLMDEPSYTRLVSEVRLLQAENMPEKRRFMTGPDFHIPDENGKVPFAVFGMKVLVAGRDKLPWSAISRQRLADPLDLLPPYIS